MRTRVDNEKVGKVHDVLLDERSRTRYLDVELDGGRHVLMPSGEAEVDAGDKVVHVPGLDRKGLSTLPEYDHRPESITPEYARSLDTAYDNAYSAEHHHTRSDYSAGWARGGDKSSTGKLARLDKLDDVKVASDNPDPRGWEVVDAAGRKIGKVDHLIGDTGSMKARYLTVKLDDDLAAGRRQVLMPVGHVDLDTRRNRVVSTGIARDRIGTLPAYEGGTIDRDYERNLTRQYGEAYTGESRYEHPRYRADHLNTEEARVERSEEEVTVGKRERQAGEVDVKKRVEHEKVREPVTVHHEEVEVERHAATGRTDEATIGEDEVRIPITEEEVVVEKKPRVKEEIVVRKKDVEETEMVEEDVRKERVDVERKGENRGRR